MKVSEFAARHEEGMFRFMEPTRRKRHREFLANPKRRGAAPGGLNDLDHRYTVNLSIWDPDSVLDYLRERGAPRDCYAVSELSELDDLRDARKLLEGWDDLGVRFSLEEALNLVFFSDCWTFLSCLPGKLAFITYATQGHWVVHRPD